MNYEKHYNLLMEKSAARVLTGYAERHHIIPKCLGGSDDPSNIAILTPEEHFLAHQLLVKMYPTNRKLILAAMFMTTHNSNKRINNKYFGWLKRRFSESMSGDNNPNRRDPLIQKEAAKKRLGQRRSEETKKRMSEAQQGKQLTPEHKLKLKESAQSRKKPLDKTPVFMYNEEGQFICKFESIYDCEKQTNILRSMIKGVANGKHQHVNRHMFFWNFLGDNISPLKVEYNSKGKPKSERHIENQKRVLSIRHKCNYCNFESSKSAINRYHNNRCKYNPNRELIEPVELKIYVCPHCGKEGAGPAMKRFHFDRCKKKKHDICN